MKELLERSGNGLMAFAGVVVSATGPIDWQNPQFWGGVILTVIPAVRNSGEYIFNKVKK